MILIDNLVGSTASLSDSRAARVRWQLSRLKANFLDCNLMGPRNHRKGGDDDDFNTWTNHSRPRVRRCCLWELWSWRFNVRRGRIELYPNHNGFYLVGYHVGSYWRQYPPTNGAWGKCGVTRGLSLCRWRPDATFTVVWYILKGRHFL